MSFNFMATVIICSDFGTQENKVSDQLDGKRRPRLVWGGGRAALSALAVLPSHRRLVSAASEAPFQGFCDFPAWLSLGFW